MERIETEFFAKKSESRIAVVYARVSSHDQKKDLVRQEQKLGRFCSENKIKYDLISGLGSGINYNKPGLKKLIQMICLRKVSKLVLTHRDRLLRFGSPLLFILCDFFGTQVIVLDDQPNKSFEQELVQDVIEIMTVFTARMYGKRAHKNKSKLEQKAV